MPRQAEGAADPDRREHSAVGHPVDGHREHLQHGGHLLRRQHVQWLISRSFAYACGGGTARAISAIFGCGRARHNVLL
jgi:hypothetical protein